MINQWIAYLLMFSGLTFALLGVIGIIRMTDFYSRLQTAIKCVSFGSSVILLGVFVYFGMNPAGYKALLAIGIILITAPVSAHALARSAYHSKTAMFKEAVIDEYAKDFPLKEDKS